MSACTLSAEGVWLYTLSMCEDTAQPVSSLPSATIAAAAARKGLKNRLSRLWKGAAGETGPVQVSAACICSWLSCWLLSVLPVTRGVCMPCSNGQQYGLQALQQCLRHGTF